MQSEIDWKGLLLGVEPEQMRLSSWRYQDFILRALVEFRGLAHRQKIIARVGELRRHAGVNVPRNLEQTVQQAFERHCQESDLHDGSLDRSLFCWPRGKGEGTWGINEHVAKRYAIKKLYVPLLEEL